MRDFHTRWLFLFALVAGSAAFPAGADLQSDVNALLRGQNLGATDVSISVADVIRNEKLVSIKSDAAMIPASNMKLLTSAAALRVLGPEFRFRTRLMVAQTGTQNKADLVVKGDGDPAFCDRELLDLHYLDVEKILDRWVASVKKSGVTHVRRLVLDDRIFDREFIHEDWPKDQLHYRYCAQIAGINFYNNTLDVWPKPTTTGRTPHVDVFPDSPLVSSTNRAVTGDADRFGIHRRDGSNHLVFFGKVKNRRTRPFEVTVHDPAMMFGSIFANHLKKAGITVETVTRPNDDERFKGARTVQLYVTTLPMVLQRCNKDSQNLFAEAMFKRIGFQYTGSAGSWTTGSAATRAQLRALLGADAASIRVTDGSGMSRNNRISSRLVVDLLATMYNDKKLGPTFVESLSVAGEDGTLRGRLQRGVKAEVRGKSGYLNQVTTLSGYLIFNREDEAPATESDDKKASSDQKDSPRPLRVIAFSLLFNNYEAPIYHHDIKALQDKIVDLIDQTIHHEIQQQLQTANAPGG